MGVVQNIPVAELKKLRDEGKAVLRIEHGRGRAKVVAFAARLPTQSTDWYELRVWIHPKWWYDIALSGLFADMMKRSENMRLYAIVHSERAVRTAECFGFKVVERGVLPDGLQPIVWARRLGLARLPKSVVLPTGKVRPRSPRLMVL